MNTDTRRVTVSLCFAVLHQLRSSTQCRPTRSRHCWSALC